MQARLENFYNAFKSVYEKSENPRTLKTTLKKVLEKYEQSGTTISQGDRTTTDPIEIVFENLVSTLISTKDGGGLKPVSYHIEKLKKIRESSTTKLKEDGKYGIFFARLIEEAEKAEEEEEAATKIQAALRNFKANKPTNDVNQKLSEEQLGQIAEKAEAAAAATKLFSGNLTNQGAQIFSNSVNELGKAVTLTE